MTSKPPTIIVVAAVIERAGSYLLARRIAGTHLAGLWEFPGGKCMPGETHESCLARELMEELGIRVAIGPEIFRVDHEYPDRTVRLHFRLCALSEEPQPLLGQELRWVHRTDLAQLEFPPADRDLIAMLRQ